MLVGPLLQAAPPKGKPESNKSGSKHAEQHSNTRSKNSTGGNGVGGKAKPVGSTRSHNSAHGDSTHGGNWSPSTHNSGKNNNASDAERNSRRERDANTGLDNSTNLRGAVDNNRKTPQISGAEGAAAGAAVANRNSPQFSGAEGAAAGAAVANRNSPQFSGAEGAAAVRNSYNNPHLYDQQWYGAHPGAWAPNGLVGGAAWAPSTWANVSSYCGADQTPVPYNYGTNVTCQEGSVSADGQNLGTAGEFSQQAADLAQMGAQTQVADTDDWLPLGVYAMVRNEQQHAQTILQLAINKQGILRGNYTDELTEQTQPVQGAVDPKTQRAAWTVGENNLSIIEAGLSNLSQDEAPVLIHRRGATDHWLLVRLHQPGQAVDAKAGSTNDNK